MKKTILSLVMVVAVAFSLFTFVFASEAASPSYNIPLATKAPTVDGGANDAAWKNALTIDISPSAVKKNGGWAQTSSNGATGTVKVVWTEGNKGGLYFLWQIKDKTQSFAFPVGANVINAMDCVQLCFDPTNARKAKLTGKECQVYTFAPYTARSGNGFLIFPEDGPTWFEHYCWVDMNKSTGVKLAVKLNGKTSTGKDLENRGFDVTGYTLEAFIPFKALKVDAGQIEGKVGTAFGIGFLLVDYDWNHSKFVADKGPTAQAEKYQKLLNISATYTNGSGTNRNNICTKPKKYNTAYLADASGKLPDNVETTNPDNGDENPTTAAIDDSEKLSEIIAQIEATDLSVYTQESVKTLNAALEEAKKFKDDDTSDEAKAAKEVLIAAYAGLVLNEENPTTDNTDNSTTDNSAATTTEAPAENNGGFKWWIIVIIVVAVAAIGAVVAVVVSKGKKKQQ